MCCSTFAVTPKRDNGMSQRQNVRSHFSGLAQDLIAFRGLRQTFTTALNVISASGREHTYPAARYTC